ncbi:hypothetical protein CFR75_11130 [Komagataeibacter xylinus]|uniref:Uncharacterized protein n=1 Tax=Komagataeibacter xylinus TaxID=28448 RepID=A0A318PJZ2_KOMXY|nr:hypothetical protein [Komagataeibacter xylinus]PYD56365.1 hypothetical protein CFR75_11130 [Komagataeibacter xylinus]GBQ74922.1 hypothetical protein AA15237_2002 [Komagataeibacter xylinus NBRC 15237]
MAAALPNPEHAETVRDGIVQVFAFITSYRFLGNVALIVIGTILFVVLMIVISTRLSAPKNDAV